MGSRGQGAHLGTREVSCGQPTPQGPGILSWRHVKGSEQVDDTFPCEGHSSTHGKEGEAHSVLRETVSLVAVDVALGLGSGRAWWGRGLGSEVAQVHGIASGDSLEKEDTHTPPPPF